MPRFARSLLVSLLAITGVACSSDSTGPGNDSLAGTYNAVTVDGAPLPHTVASGTTVISYTITVRSDHSYDLAFAKTSAGGARSDISDTGTYAYNESTGALSFTGQIPGVLHATVTDGGSTMTLSSADVGGYTIVLKK